MGNNNRLHSQVINKSWPPVVGSANQEVVTSSPQQDPANHHPAAILHQERSPESSPLLTLSDPFLPSQLLQLLLVSCHPQLSLPHPSHLQLLARIPCQLSTVSPRISLLHLSLIYHCPDLRSCRHITSQHI